MGAPLVRAAPDCLAPRPRSARDSVHATDADELAADLVIIGGGLGGCAAALATPRRGFSEITTRESDWIGGQLTYYLGHNLADISQRTARADAGRIA